MFKNLELFNNQLECSVLKMLGIEPTLDLNN